MAGEHPVDVRDGPGLARALAEAAPEIVIHLAAQPMVRRSLIDPVGTFDVNVAGTVNLLEAVRAAGFEPSGTPRRKPKHFEIDGRRDGKPYELHVELDGRIRKTKPAGEDAAA